MTPTRPLRTTILIAIALIARVQPGAADASRSWEVVKDDVTIVCPMTVGGSFEARTDNLTGTLLEERTASTLLRGTLSVDLRTLATGIALRDRHLRDTYLEVGKGEGYERAALSDIDLGDVDLDRFRGKTPFSATFLLHGVTRVIRGEAELLGDAATLRVAASFPLRLGDYRIPNTRYLGVGVKDEVRVRVALVAAPAHADARAE